jgi:lysophospholipase L1-like esterase
MVMKLLRIKTIVICVTLLTLSCLLAWEAEKAARRTPGLMLPHWRIRYFRNHTKKSRVISDPEIGFLMAPNLADEIRTPDFTFLRTTDSKGFPNRDPWPKQADIVFLGDSLIVGEGVGQAGNFSQLIIDTMPNLKIINLGIPAAGPERQYPTFARFGAALQPRIVVSCLYLASDFENDKGFRSWLRRGQNTAYSEYRLRYQIDETSPFSLERLFERSWLLGMVRESFQRSFTSNSYPLDRYRFPDGKEIWFDIQAAQFANEAATAQDHRADAMLQSVLKLRDLVLHHNAKLLVMLIPSKEELFAVSDSARNRNIVARTRQRLKEARLAILDLYPALLQAGATHAPYFKLDIHLNDYGNRIVADQFVSWLQTHAKDIGL